MRDDVTNFLVKWKRGLVVNASRALFTIKEKYSVIVVYSSPFFAMPHWCIAYRLDFRRSLVSGPRAFGGGARTPFPNSGWWSSLGIPLLFVSLRQKISFVYVIYIYSCFSPKQNKSFNGVENFDFIQSPNLEVKKSPFLVKITCISKVVGRLQSHVHTRDFG